MYLFALFLVLYEFTTYSANDMIMPGMIQVVKEFQASESFVALSMSVYLLGNCFFVIAAGYMAELQGKRKTMLIGSFLFLLFTVLIVYSHSIQQFISYRFLQGVGLAIIAIGYAYIHENFNDKAAVKLIALMANVSILAPLLGPVMGSAIMSFYTWQHVFWITALFAAITFVGLFFTIPRKKPIHQELTAAQITKQYGQILLNKEFLFGSICSVVVVIPLIIWIAQAPNLVLYKLQLDYKHYVIYQLISISGLSISSIAMQFIAGKFRMYSIILLGNILIGIGLAICFFGYTDMTWVAVGLMVYAFGMGLAEGCIIRIIMTIKGFSNSTLAAMLGFMQMSLFALVLTVTNEFMAQFRFSLWSFVVSICVFGVIGFLLVLFYLPKYRGREWT